MKKLMPLLLIMSLVLSGCWWEKEEPAPPPPPTDKQVSVLDLKTQYGESPDKGIMPLYNVSPSEEFVFRFNSYVGDLPPHEVLSVHTDVQALGDSRIDVEITPESYVVGPSTLYVKPASATLDPDVEGEWGRAPIYYISLNYDLDAKEPTKLEKPIIIPFTIKRGIEAPTLSYTLDSQGNLTLKWSKVEGATSYEVYNLSRPTSTDKVNPLELTASEVGFEGVYSYPIATVKGTEFNDWLGKGKNGLYTAKGLKQNEGLNGSYYVIALKGKEKSQSSNIIETSKLAYNIPTELLEDINKSQHETIRSLPKSTKVEMYSGELADMPIIYNTEKVKITEGKPTTIPFTVLNTIYKGSVTVEKITDVDLEALTLGNYSNSTSKFSAPKSNISYVPTSELPTVIQPSPQGVAMETEGAKDEEVSKEKVEGTTEEEVSSETEASKEGVTKEITVEPSTEATGESSKESTDTKEVKPTGGKTELTAEELAKLGKVYQQKVLTEQLIAQANTETVIRPAYFEVQGVNINANSALEEYLALSLLEGRTTISLKAFPYAQTYSVLEDTLQKVIYQNPLILGVSEYSYNYVDSSLTVSYTEAPSYSKQEELVVEAKKVVESVITEGMSTSDKSKAIYDYLVENTEFYDESKEKEVTEEPVKEENLDKKLTEEPVKEENLDKKVTEEPVKEENPNKETQKVEGKQEESPVQVKKDSAYDILINKVGTDLGYANAYKLLSTISGLDTVTVTGVLNGKPHAWNKLNLDGSWVNIDVSNNSKTVGIPYMVFNSDDKTILASNFVSTEDFWLDSEISNFLGTNNSQDYYIVNKLEVASLDEYLEQLGSRLQSGEKTVVLRSPLKLDPQQLYDATGSALQTYAPDKLATSQFGVYDNYLIITTELPEEDEEVKEAVKEDTTEIIDTSTQNEEE